MKLNLSGTKSQTPEPILGSDEDTFRLVEQGVCLIPGRSSWQMGQLQLGADRIRFVQPRGVLFNVPLPWLKGIALERKLYVVVRKPAMALTYHDPRLRDVSTAWFITPRLGQWMNAISEIIDQQPEATALTVAEAEHVIQTVQRSERLPTGQDGAKGMPFSEREIEQLVQSLDIGSQAIVRHLWLNGHARIDELADLICAPAHMDVLFKIQRSINPQAQAMLGRPALTFQEAAWDPICGEHVTFEWWLAGWQAPIPIQEHSAEIFEEDDYILVVIELPGVSERAVQASAAGDLLEVWIEDGAAQNCRTIRLPAVVDGTQTRTQMRNGVLSVRMPQVEEERKP